MSKTCSNQNKHVSLHKPTVFWSYRVVRSNAHKRYLASKAERVAGRVASAAAAAVDAPVKFKKRKGLSDDSSTESADAADSVEGVEDLLDDSTPWEWKMTCLQLSSCFTVHPLMRRCVRRSKRVCSMQRVSRVFINQVRQAATTLCSRNLEKDKKHLTLTQPCPHRACVDQLEKHTQKHVPWMLATKIFGAGRWSSPPP